MSIASIILASLVLAVAIAIAIAFVIWVIEKLIQRKFPWWNWILWFNNQSEKALVFFEHYQKRIFVSFVVIAALLLLYVIDDIMSPEAHVIALAVLLGGGLILYRLPSWLLDMAKQFEEITKIFAHPTNLELQDPKLYAKHMKRDLFFVLPKSKFH